MDIFNYQRRETSVVHVGAIDMGGDNPIRIQSMTTTNTNDTDACVEQAEDIIKAGGELVRLTTQGSKEAENLKNINSKLRADGYTTPLVADVHFNPNVADVAALYAEKVRINPGNYVDPARKFIKQEYSDEEYAQELKKIENRFVPFLDICKKNHTAIRIGVNHGSLSPRIMNRYGDTPEGLAASCMEFLELCQLENFHQIVISVKASNTLVMVQAVRLLVQKMDAAGFHYPLHLGVTEAGEGEDGRIKSAVGIGALLADGIGDTIRVSLSEDPECEIPVAKQLAEYIATRENHPTILGTVAPQFNPLTFKRRETHAIETIGGNHTPVIIARKAGNYEPMPDYILENGNLELRSLCYSELTDSVIAELKATPQVLLLHSNHINPVGEMRAFFHKLMVNGVTAPVILWGNYAEENLETLQIKVGADLGALLLDGFGDGVLLTNDGTTISN